MQGVDRLEAFALQNFEETLQQYPAKVDLAFVPYERFLQLISTALASASLPPGFEWLKTEIGARFKAVLDKDGNRDKYNQMLAEYNRRQAPQEKTPRTTGVESVSAAVAAPAQLKPKRTVLAEVFEKRSVQKDLVAMVGTVIDRFEQGDIPGLEGETFKNKLFSPPDFEDVVRIIEREPEIARVWNEFNNAYGNRFARFVRVNVRPALGVCTTARARLEFAVAVAGEVGPPLFQTNMRLGRCDVCERDRG